MFDPLPHSRVFAVPLGVDFPQALVTGLRARLSGQAPEAVARTQIIVNTARMRRRISDLFALGAPGLLPQITLLSDIGRAPQFHDIPQAPDALSQRMALVPLVHSLLQNDPRLAVRRSLFDLSDTLAALMDEMQGEGVAVEDILSLDVSDASDHWDRAKQFIGIVQQFLDLTESAPDAEARQRLITQRLIANWHDTPPDHPIILAGSTGSRGTTALLMKAIAALPQGAVILPGFDRDMPPAIWEALLAERKGQLSPEDHPQYRFAKLMQEMDLTPDLVPDWSATPAADPARNRVMSLALRPVPVTDSWLREGPLLGGMPSAMQGLTLLQAPTPRLEALSIAMRLRRAVEEGKTAALITPDRMLTRQVTAALDRWNITPDDSAGMPLQLSPPGRFLRHTADLIAAPLTAESLLTLLKHPLTHSAGGRNDHLLHTRDLELHLRDKGPAFPDASFLRSWSAARDCPAWGDWMARAFCDLHRTGAHPADRLAEHHLAISECIAQGSEEGQSELWKESAGREAHKAMQRFMGVLTGLPNLTPREYGDLFGGVLSRGEVRNRDAGHPNVLIWGTLEARVQGAELLILAGLNEGTWPEAPSPDPWLNRRMRQQAGLLLPERRIGLSAHDFQQAISAPEVWLTRSARSDDAETVPSRWLNRLTNLLGGLPETQGPEALDQMIARGDHWLKLGAALEAVTPVPPAPRPSPRPPVAARPVRLSVTQIKTLVRDPYAIYARNVLGLSPLDSIVKTADARLRGIAAHRVFEEFIKHRDEGQTKDDLLKRAHQVFAEEVDWPSARLLWEARIARIAEEFVTAEADRQAKATPQHFEKKGKVEIADLGFTLSGIADRIDIDARGGAYVYDYKTGAVPSKDQQKAFDMQLMLLSAMVMRGGFDGVAPRHIEGAEFLEIGTSAKQTPAPLDEMSADQAWHALRKLIETYQSPDQGFTARRAMDKSATHADFDLLARFGEWDETHASDPDGVLP